MAVALVFPGQGSQAVGMGRALADAFASARQVFAEVDAALGERLSDVIWNGPQETLTLTQNAQPALMAVSLAALRVLEAEAGVKLDRDAAFRHLNEEVLDNCTWSGRMGDPGEYANVIAFLLSDAAAEITGTVVEVPGSIGLPIGALHA